ncbi:MAG: tRNA adenosine(34) deaminase TadA [Clostridia bacterium]|nr:tRNA adenosine(34) deaminase TadA [Clostridia bacterium]
MSITESNISVDERYMKEALVLAETAYAAGEIPVGAIVVKNGEIIGRGYNLREKNKSAVSHAEIIAIEEACKRLGGWRLSDCTLYVTLEPCPMCAGAIVNSRIKRVVFGCKDSVAGCCGSIINLNCYPFNHAFVISDGVCEDECKSLLKKFFEQRRRK